MDVVEFVEQVLGLHLMDYQKEFLIKVYEATRDGQSVMYIPGRCYHRSSNLFTQKRLYGQKPIRRNSEYDSHKY